MYRGNITESQEKPGYFVARLFARLGENFVEIEVSVSGPDPEYLMCHEIKKLNMTDDCIQFYRGETPSLFFKSVYKAADYRIELGNRYPYRLVRRRLKRNFR